MKQEKNYGRFGLFIIAAAIIAVSSIAINEATSRASAPIDQPIALAARTCVIYQTYPATIDCSLAIGPSIFKVI
jgi:hypothetical protein